MFTFTIEKSVISMEVTGLELITYIHGFILNYGY
jgi:hypothetical protein